jgi:hypothetical protein
VPSATSATLKADPAIPVASSRVYAALRLDSATPFNRGGILGRRRALSPGMTCRLRHLSPEALAPDGLCYSVHHRLIGLIRQSGGLRVLSRTPVMDTVLDIRGSQHPVCSLLAPRADRTGTAQRPPLSPEAFTSGLPDRRVAPCVCRI